MVCAGAKGKSQPAGGLPFPSRDVKLLVKRKEIALSKLPKYATLEDKNKSRKKKKKDSAEMGGGEEKKRKRKKDQSHCCHIFTLSTTISPSFFHVFFHSSLASQKSLAAVGLPSTQGFLSFPFSNHPLVAPTPRLMIR